MNVPLREQRFVEETGGFSLIIPRSWEIVDMPISDFKMIRVPNENGVAPSIGFYIDTFNGPLDLRVDHLIRNWSIHAETFMVIQRSDFVTLSNLRGKRIIAISTVQGLQGRQVIYILPGENNTSLLVICTSHAEDGDFFDEHAHISTPRKNSRIFFQLCHLL